jgi:hypothetical protein
MSSLLVKNQRPLQQTKTDAALQLSSMVMITSKTIYATGNTMLSSIG